MGKNNGISDLVCEILLSHNLVSVVIQSVRNHWTILMHSWYKYHRQSISYKFGQDQLINA